MKKIINDKHFFRLELHSHSHYSSDSNLTPETLIKQSIKKGLDAVAITDHNTTKGAEKASIYLKENKSRYSEFQVIIGEEVRTNFGDVLLYNLNDEIKVNKNENDFYTIMDNIRQQGAAACIAHPFRTIPPNQFQSPIKNIAKYIDGIETINGRTLPFQNKKAQYEAESNSLGQIAGSDAHFGFELGNCVTLVNANFGLENIESLGKAIRQKVTIPTGCTKGHESQSSDLTIACNSKKYIAKGIFGQGCSVLRAGKIIFWRN